MGLTILKLIPTNPDFIPAQQSQSEAIAFLTKYFTENQMEAKITEAIEFVDQGMNFESVSCNLCGKEISTENWQAAMDISYEQRFKDLTFVSACCNRTVSLNDLDYVSPAGFSQFVVSISDPQTEITQNDVLELQAILKTSLREIWARY